jgi:hypothetical protein
MAKKGKPTTDAVEIMRRRYFEGQAGRAGSPRLAQRARY